MFISMQRKRMLEQMKDGLESRGWMIVARCATGLGIVALIALVGAGNADRGANAVRGSATQSAAKAAEQHRRVLFDQRRERYEQQTDGGRFASGKRLPSDGAAPVAIQ
jgi:hypothetical protein